MGKRTTPRVGENEPEIGSRKWRIRNLELDERLFELRIGNHEVRIEPKPLGILMVLLRNADRVVTAAEMAKMVWGGRSVSEQVIAQCVARLRRSLGPEHEDLVRTIHGWGYRLSELPEGSKAALRPGRGGKDLRAGDDHPLRRGWKLVAPIAHDPRGWLIEHADSGLCRYMLHLRRTGEINHAAQEISSYNGAVAGGKLEGLIAHAQEWNFDLTRAPALIEYPANLLALTAWVERQGGFKALPLARRLKLMIDVGERLEGAHRQGFSFGRISPASVLFGPHRATEPVFFLPGAMGRIDPICPRLYCGPWKGNEALYTAPELLGGASVTSVADVYSLGVLILQMIVGDWSLVPVPGWEELDMPPACRVLVRQATQLDTAKRIPTVRAIVQHLREALGPVAEEAGSRNEGTSRG